MSSTGSREARARVELDKAEKASCKFKKFRLNFYKSSEFAKNFTNIAKDINLIRLKFTNRINLQN